MHHINRYFSHPTLSGTLDKGSQDVHGGLDVFAVLLAMALHGLRQSVEQRFVAEVSKV